MRELISSLRPRQWIKNGFVFAALLFSTTFTEPGRYPPVLLTFLSFCMLSSGMYLLNDVCDRRNDRKHPLKRNRPIAAGQLNATPAIAWSLALTTAGLALTVGVNLRTFYTALAYVAMIAAYSLGFKRVVYLDVAIVAMGFVLRALAGAYAVRVYPSPWLLACTFLLALFLTLNKRLHELTVLEDESHVHRPVLASYSRPLLIVFIWAVAGLTMGLYAIYVVQPSTVRQLKTEGLIWTIPFVVYGMARYAHLSIEKNKGGTPTETLLTDWRLLLAVAGWAGTVCLLVFLGMEA